MSTRCRCGHHRLTHTYTVDGNVGRCCGHRRVGGEHNRCKCTAYKPTEEEE